MRCPHCGKWNRATFPVCFSCGEPLPQADKPAARTAAPALDKAEQPVTVVYDEYGDERTVVDQKDRLAEEMQDLHQRKKLGEQRQEELRRQAADKGFAPTGTGVTAASRRSRVFVEPGRVRSAYPRPDEQQVDYDGYTAEPTYARAGASRGDRINTANAYGGPLLAMKTVNELLGLNISRYASVNFQGFMEVVNLLGGVELTLSDGEARLTGAEKSDQPQRLNGYQTLEYARIRSLDNNFGRNERQRKVLSTLLEQARAQDRDTVMRAVTEGLGWMQTNLTAEEVLSLVVKALGSQQDIELLSLPPEGKYRFARSKSGASVIEFNQNTVRNAFHQFVYGQEAPPVAK